MTSLNQDVILTVLRRHAPGWASLPTILELAPRVDARFDSTTTQGVAQSLAPLVRRGTVEKRYGGRGARNVMQYRLTPTEGE